MKSIPHLAFKAINRWRWVPLERVRNALLRVVSRRDEAADQAVA